MKTTILLFAALFMSLGAAAEPNTYIRSDGQFVTRGNDYPRGFWDPTIKGADEVFQGNATALEAYRSHQRTGRWSSIVAWGSLGALVTYAAISGDDYEPVAGILIAVAGLSTSGYLSFKSNMHLIRAMNIMNGIPESQARVRPTKDFALPLLAYTF